ncbi:MAG: threonine aldolase family protein [Actinomycetota bacterium]|nr:threonine aldolase family protein [Actinomycetota bacterium]
MAGDVADLRSDTLTRPTPAMRRAMADAEVGDDAYGEDPTVNALEEAFAGRVGKEAALFVPSGTMANQLALRVLGPAGTIVIAGRTSHVAAFEAAAAGTNTPAQLFTVDDAEGTVDPAEVAWLVEAAGHHWVRPSLVCVENTHMLAGGVPWALDRLRSLAATGLPVHADGARLFNAVVASGTSASAYAEPCTTVWTALTKGLCAPVGSVLAGPAGVVDQAREERQRMGGQLRQAGVLAAAGLVALDHMVDRLADDHARAAALAEAVAERWPDAGLDPSSVRTNIVIFGHPSPGPLIDHLAGQGVLAGTVAPRTMRLVTHHDVDDGHVERARRALASAP